jgi:hypothetical protein
MQRQRSKPSRFRVSDTIDSSREIILLRFRTAGYQREDRAGWSPTKMNALILARPRLMEFDELVRYPQPSVAEEVVGAVRELGEKTGEGGAAPTPVATEAD